MRYAELVSVSHKEMKSSYIYILTNRYRTTFYVGVTSDLQKRIIEHENGIGSTFTKKYNENLKQVQVDENINS